MSYNIDRIMAKGDLRITLFDLQRIKSAYNAELPENNFVTLTLQNIEANKENLEPGDDVNILTSIGDELSFCWSGCWSGKSYDLLKNDILPCTAGCCDLIICWESSDCHSGIRVREGVVTEHTVEIALKYEII